MKQKKRAVRETEHFFGGVISKDKRLEDKIRFEEYQKAKEKFEAKQAAKAARAADELASEEDSAEADPAPQTDVGLDLASEAQSDPVSLSTT